LFYLEGRRAVLASRRCRPTNLAAWLAHAGQDVILLDIDVQANGKTFIDRHVGFTREKFSNWLYHQIAANRRLRKRAKAIVGKGADYVMGLKGNQGTLSDKVKEFFDVTEWLNYKDFSNWGHGAEEKGHGRVQRVVT
jgi:predicted transposase YbfD/YdcC